MKLKFIDSEGCYLVKEDGKNTKKVTYEDIGFITKYEPCLKIDDDFGGILEFDEVEQIYNFIKKLKEKEAGVWIVYDLEANREIQEILTKKKFAFRFDPSLEVALKVSEKIEENEPDEPKNPSQIYLFKVFSKHDFITISKKYAYPKFEKLINSAKDSDVFVFKCFWNKIPKKYEIINLKILNENNPELFAELLKEGIDAL